MTQYTAASANNERSMPSVGSSTNPAHKRARRRSDRIPQCDDSRCTHGAAELLLDAVCDEREGRAGQQGHRQHQEHRKAREAGSVVFSARLIVREQIKAVIRGHYHEAAERRHVRQPTMTMLVDPRATLPAIQTAKTDSSRARRSA